MEPVTELIVQIGEKRRVAVEATTDDLATEAGRDAVGANDAVLMQTGRARRENGVSQILRRHGTIALRSSGCFEQNQ